MKLCKSHKDIFEFLARPKKVWKNIVLSKESQKMYPNWEINMCKIKVNLLLSYRKFGGGILTTMVKKGHVV